MSTTKKVATGDSAIVLQAEGSISLGMQYGEVRQLFEELFELNFDRLVAGGKEEANRRRGELDDALIARLPNVPQEEAARIGAPEMQRAVLRAQLEHATTGDPADVETYANLLIEKLKHPGKNLPSIACQQAIETVGSLTQEHIDALTCIFVLFFVSFQNVESVAQLRDLLTRALEPHIYAFKNDQSFLRHLDSTGCLALDGTRSFSLARNWKAYSGVGNSTFTEDEIPPQLFSVLQPYRTEVAGAPGRYELVSAQFDLGVLTQGTVDASDPGAVADLIAHLDSCRIVPDETVYSRVAEGSSVLSRVVEVVTGSEEIFVASCFLSNKGYAIAHSNLLKSFPDLAPLDVWVH